MRGLRMGRTPGLGVRLLATAALALALGAVECGRTTYSRCRA